MCSVLVVTEDEIGGVQKMKNREELEAKITSQQSEIEQLKADLEEWKGAERTLSDELSEMHAAIKQAAEVLGKIPETRIYGGAIEQARAALSKFIPQEES